MLEIDRWDEGTDFRPALERSLRASGSLGDNALDSRGRDRTIGQSIKPIGFSIAYSYTLFRKREAQHDSLYAFF